jgi:hypothetical protein
MQQQAETALRGVIAWFRNPHTGGRQTMGYGTIYRFVFEPDDYSHGQQWTPVGDGIFWKGGEHAILVEGVHQAQPAFITKHATDASFIIHSPGHTHTTNDLLSLAQYLSQMFEGRPLAMPSPFSPHHAVPMPNHPAMPFPPHIPFSHHPMISSYPQQISNPGMTKAVGLFAATVAAAAAAGGGAHIAKEMGPAAKDLLKSAAAKGANVDWQAAGNNAFTHPDAKHAVNLVSALAQGNHAAAIYAGSRLTSPYQAARLSTQLATGDHAAAAQTIAKMANDKLRQINPVKAAPSKPSTTFFPWGSKAPQK